MDPPEQALVQVGAAPSAAVAASIAANTKRTYAAALKRLDAALAGQDLTDASLSLYLARLHAAGLSPAGPKTDRVLAGLRREGKGRGRGPGRRDALQRSRHRGRVEGDPGRRRSRPLRSRIKPGVDHTTIFPAEGG